MVNTNKILKEKFLEIIVDSKFHGLSNIFANRTWLTRILWSLLFLTSTCLCSFLIYQSLLNYFSYNYTTNIDLIYEPIVPFPAVSICSETNVFDQYSNLNQVITHCMINNNNCLNNSDFYFEKFSDDLHGTCIRFNSRRINVIRSTMAGVDGGLEINLNGENIGFILYIHNQTTKLFQNSLHNNHNRQAIYVSSGFDTNLVVERIFDIRLDSPYNDCYKNISNFLFNNTLVNYIATELSDYSYSQHLCYILCFDLMFINNSTCECKNKQLGHIWENCKSDIATRDCTIKFKTAFYEGNISDQCDQYCPLECDSVSYEINSYSKLYKSPIQYNYTRIKVNYKDLKYTLISQQPQMQFTDLVSNIGGLFGLFVGASFLSFFELTEMFIELSFAIFSKK